MVSAPSSLVTHNRRLLDAPSSSSEGAPADGTVDSDVVVILAALLCTLICLVGLGFMARCAWRCRFLRRAGVGGAGIPDPSANKGLKKKAIRALPVVAFDSNAGKSTDCAICLTEFLPGEQIRVLPQCAHCFHLNCIDTWLSSHSSCPSCRHILADKPAPQPPSAGRRCERCGLPENRSPAAPAPPPSVGAGGAGLEQGLRSREDDPDRFLP
ncbi:RING-H2 finger protein ATL74-like [Nymphaea colorata]|nr:RING-H2 finger protein ATL74-like [Nymphaea colorata]